MTSPQFFFLTLGVAAAVFIVVWAIYQVVNWVGGLKKLRHDVTYQSKEIRSLQLRAYKLESRSPFADSYAMTVLKGRMDNLEDWYNRSPRDGKDHTSKDPGLKTASPSDS